MWISLVSREKAMSMARKLERDSLAPARPLYGIPFAISDNIDLAGVPTTAACPAYSYMPTRSATVVQAMLDAGAIPIGKTNLDQFGAGLAGTRSPYGPCSSVYNSRYISGGASAGAAVAVASGMAGFSLGTDTAGSVRVPAAFNGLIGLKPTRGVLSATGVVPVCRTLDCVSILAPTCHDAHTVWMAARGGDPADCYSRVARPGEGSAPWLAGRFSFGVPQPGQLEFFGDAEAARLYAEAVAQIEALGGQKIQIDFGIFRAAATLQDSGPWIAEQYAVLRQFIESHGEKMHREVRSMLENGRTFAAADIFAAEYKLRDLRRQCDAQFEQIDFLLLPTTGAIFTHEAASAHSLQIDTNLAYYTSFVNLLDLAAVAVPGGFRPDGLPFGVSFIGKAFSEEGLLAIADRYVRTQDVLRGLPMDLSPCPPGCVSVAVLGAYLTGQPLNRRLTERGGRFLKACRTAPGYRLYALEGTMPMRPGLVRDPSYSGRGIEVEIWALPEDQFGGFVAEIGPPLGIGNATLDDGQVVKCFICEPYAVAKSTEITRFGGWRNYLSQTMTAR